MNFTIQQDDRIDQRIRSDLAKIRQYLITTLPAIDMLALVGGFGRGEGCVVWVDGKCQPYNDYDILIVSPTAGGPPSGQVDAHSLAKRIGIAHIDFIFRRTRDMGSLAPTQLNFDMQRGHYVFYGSRDYLAEGTALRPGDLPNSEGHRQILNRLVCMCEAIQLSNRELITGDAVYSSHQVAKVFWGLLDAALIRQGLYTDRIAHKLPLVPQVWPTEDASELSREAYAAKLLARPSRLPVSTFWQKVRHHYQAALHDTRYGHPGDLPDAWERSIHLQIDHQHRRLSPHRLWRAVSRDPLWGAAFHPRGCELVYIPLLFAMAGFPGYIDEAFLSIAERMLAMDRGNRVDASSRWELARRNAVSNWYRYNH